MKRILPIILTGLFTKPVNETSPGSTINDDCGMLGLAEELRTKMPECEVLDAIAYSWDGASIGTLVTSINGSIKSAGIRSGDAVVIQCHSFGNNLGVKWAELGEKPDGVTVIYVGHDPCREFLRYGDPEWVLGPLVDAGIVHYQRDGRPDGVCGSPFEDRPNLVQIDVSTWDNPCLGHVDCTTIEGFQIKQCTGIIKDTRVRAAVYAVVRGVVLEGKTVQQVIDGLSAAWHAEHPNR